MREPTLLHTTTDFHPVSVFSSAENVGVRGPLLRRQDWPFWILRAGLIAEGWWQTLVRP